MKSNDEMGCEEIIRVGDYEIGKIGTMYRGYGYEYFADQDVSKERTHHEVCAVAGTIRGAINLLVDRAIVAGKVSRFGHNGITLRGLSVVEGEVLRNELLAALDDLELEREQAGNK